jgi:hypothetical protein
VLSIRIFRKIFESDNLMGGDRGMSKDMKITLSLEAAL